MPQFNTPIQNSQFDPYSYEKQIEKLSGNSQGLQDTPIGNVDSTINPISSVKAEDGFSLLSSDEEARSTMLESKAADQGVLELTGKMLYNIVDTALFELAKTPGYVVGGLGALGKEIATGGKADTMGMIVDNFWVNAFEKLQQDSKDALPVYISKDVQEGNLITKALSGEWWASTGAEGIGFLLSMMIPGQASKLLGLGAKLGTGLETIGNSSKWAGKVLSKTGVLQDLSKSGQFALKNAFGPGADSVISASLNTFTEAAAEGANTFDNVKKKLVASGVSEEDANKQAGNAAAGVFKANLVLLSVSNLLDEAWIWKEFSNVQKKGGNEILDKIFTRTNKDGAILDLDKLEKLSKKGWKDVLIEGSANLGKQFAKEGFYEEGSQTTLQQNIEKNGDAGLLNNLYNVGANYFTDFLNNQELQESIFLGGILGGGMSVVETRGEIQNYNNALFGNSAYTPSSFWGKLLGRKEKKEQPGLIGLFKDNYINNFQSILDVAKKDNTGKPLFKDGKVIVDEDKYAALAEEKANLLDAHIKYDIATATNNKVAQDALGDILTFNYLQPFLQQEGGFEVFKEHLPQVTEAWAKQYEQTTGVAATDEQKNNFKSQLETKAEEFNKLYEEVEQTHSPERFVSNNNTQEYQEWKSKLFNDKLNLGIQNRSIKRTEQEIIKAQKNLESKMFADAVDEMERRDSKRTEFEKTTREINSLKTKVKDVTSLEREIKGRRDGLVIQMVQKLGFSVKEAEEKVGDIRKYAEDENKDFEQNRQEGLYDLRNHHAKRYRTNRLYLESLDAKEKLAKLEEKLKTLPKETPNLSDFATDPVSIALSKFYEANLKEVQKQKPILKDDYLKLFTKEGVNEHYNNFFKNKQALQEASAETLADEQEHAQGQEDIRNLYRKLLTDAEAFGYSTANGEEPIIMQDKSGKRYTIDVDENGNPTITGISGTKPLTPKMLDNLKIVNKASLKGEKDEHTQDEPTSEPSSNPESLSDVFVEKQLGLNRFVVAGLNVLYETSGQRIGKDVLLDNGLPKLNESISQQNWYNKMDQIARDPKDDISNYRLIIYKPKYDDSSDLEKQISQNNPPRSRTNEDLVAILADENGIPLSENDNLFFTSIWRPEVLYAQKPRLAPDAILQPLLRKIGVPYTPYKTLKVSSFTKQQIAKINKYLNIQGNKDFTLDSLYNKAIEEAREEYTNWYNKVVELNDTSSVTVKPTHVTQGKPLTKRDKQGNIIWQPVLKNVPGISLQKNEIGSKQLSGAKLVIVPKSGNLLVSKNLTFSGKPGDVVLTVNADNNALPLKSRFLDPNEISLVMYLLSLGDTANASVPLKKGIFFKVGNLEIKDKVNVFFYRTGDKNLNSQLKNFSLISTLINYGKKQREATESDEDYATRSKGSIYLEYNKDTKETFVKYVDWSGNQETVSLNELKGAVNAVNFENFTPNIAKLYKFLEQKRLNVNEPLLNQNGKFPKPKLTNKGKFEIEFDNSKTYYEHLLDGKDRVLSTSLVTEKGYPQFLQRNVAFDSTITTEEDPMKVKSKKKEKSPAKPKKEVKQEKPNKQNVIDTILTEEDESNFIFDDVDEEAFNKIREEALNVLKSETRNLNNFDPIQDGDKLLKEIEQKNTVVSQPVSEISLNDLPDLDTGLDADKILSPNQLLTMKLQNGEIKQNCK